MPQDPDELIPIGQAARIASVSVDTIRRWESIGKIAAVRTAGGQRRFRRGDVDALTGAAPSEPAAAS
jgi:excisionase family DNA binding protein